jgi:hypothetical protein
MRIAPLAAFGLLALAAPAAAQDAPGPRSFTVTPGIGNAMGWFGAQAERYFTNDRLSLFVGLGYTPELESGDPSGITFAAGARGYTGGARHRGFLELSVSQIVIELWPEEGRHYGPGLQAGYQYVAGGGFTLMGSAGVGYAPGIGYAGDGVEPLLGLGVGYTWRR